MDQPSGNNEEKGYYSAIAELRQEIAILVIRQFNNSLIIKKLLDDEDLTEEDYEFLEEQEKEFEEIKQLSKNTTK